MHPLFYLKIRALLSCLQFSERAERAFVQSTAVLVGAGVVHSWAVVHALFVAVHTRAIRIDGYHEGYVEHLPGSVAWTETLATVCYYVWVGAGLAGALLQIADDGPALDVGKADLFTALARSPQVHAALNGMHSASCVSLFLCQLSLCLAVAVMPGSISGCEVCLVLVSVGFALPHAVLAVRRVSDGLDQALGTLLPADTLEAAAAEASTYGPQLCIILGLADAPGHAYTWQNLVYAATACAFLAGVAFCGRSPPIESGSAVPPAPENMFGSVLLTACAAGVMVLSYPELSSWTTGIGLILLIGLAGATVIREPNVQSLYMEWIEPIFVVQTEARRRPCQHRERALKCSRAMAFLCALVGLWDMKFHETVHGGQSYVMPDWSFIMMLRWQSSYSGSLERSDMLRVAADAMGVDTGALQMKHVLPDHRVMIFTANITVVADITQTSAQWVTAVGEPKGELAKVLDNTFPATLNYGACAVAQTAGEHIKDDDVGAAYAAACEWMSVHTTTAKLLLHQQVLKTLAEKEGSADSVTPPESEKGQAIGAADSEQEEGSDLS